MNSDTDHLIVDPADADVESNEAPQVLDPSILSGEQVTISSDSNSNSSGNGSNSSGISSPVITRKRWFILEPAVFPLFLALYLSSSVYQNQILYQTCVSVYHFNESDCKPLLGVSRESEEAKRLETIVQPYCARILMARSLLESVIPAIISLFIGPWSDKFGRRPIILTTFTGYFFSMAILTSLAFIASKVTTFSPWLFLLCSVPSAMSGGMCALITGLYCYISDVAKSKAKAFRMVLNEASLCAGMMVGNIAGGYIYAATNAVTVFGISTIAMLIALTYVYFFVVESLKPEQIHTGSRVREFFRFDLVKDVVRTCFARRPSFDRAIILLTMTSLTIAIFSMEGDGNVTYLFIRKQFQWTLKEYNLFGSARIVVQIVGSVLGMLFLRRVLKFSIVSMTMISLASCVLESTVRATAVFWWEMYLGMFLGLMRGIMGPMSRAILSHVAPANEVGKIFALTTSLESLSPLGAAPLYTSVYNATLEYYPGLFNFITAGLYMLCYTLIATIYGLQKSLGNTATYQAIGS